MQRSFLTFDLGLRRTWRSASDQGRSKRRNYRTKDRRISRWKRNQRWPSTGRAKAYTSRSSQEGQHYSQRTSRLRERFSRSRPENPRRSGKSVEDQAERKRYRCAQDIWTKEVENSLIVIKGKWHSLRDMARCFQRSRYLDLNQLDKGVNLVVVVTHDTSPKVNTWVGSETDRSQFREQNSFCIYQPMIFWQSNNLHLLCIVCRWLY